MQHAESRDALELAQEYIDAASAALHLANSDREQITIARQLLAGAIDLIDRASD